MTDEHSNAFQTDDVNKVDTLLNLKKEAKRSIYPEQDNRFASLAVWCALGFIVLTIWVQFYSAFW
jgi:hypothetical protein